MDQQEATPSVLARKLNKTPAINHKPDNQLEHNQSKARVMGTSTIGTTTTSGQSSTIDIRQPFNTANYVINLTGQFPSRSLSQGLNYAGGVYLFGGNFAPEGYAFCEGQILSINDYPALYAVIGNTYGGAAASGTFALPNLQGRVPIGTGASPDSDLPEIHLGMQLGHAFETTTAAPEHDHAITNGGSVAPTGSNPAHLNLLMPSLGMTPVISVEGAYPSRSISTEPTLGDISWFAGSFTPKGYLPADGRTLSISGNEALFSLIGATFGGNGINTFALPDLRGRVAIHANDAHPLGSTGGAFTSMLNLQSLPSHNHSIPGTNSETTATGSDQAISLMQPYLSVNYVMPLDGPYPRRSLGDARDPSKSHPLSIEPTLGSMGMTARTFPSQNMAFTTGQILPITQYISLYSILGTAFGGNGITNFALPNLSGRSVLGRGNTAETNYGLGEMGGNEKLTLTQSQLYQHLHQYELSSQWWTGSQNDSILRGGTEDDLLAGGAGNNVMEGGDGADAFIITNTNSHNVILDFKAEEDHIELGPRDQNISVIHHRTYASVLVDGLERAIVYGDHRSLTLPDPTTLA